jgi:hypothetical protein
VTRRAADSLKESQPAAGQQPFTRYRTSPGTANRNSHHAHAGTSPTGDQRHSESQSGPNARQREKRVNSPPVGSSSRPDVTAESKPQA